MWYVIQTLAGSEAATLEYVNRLVGPAGSRVLAEAFIPQRETMRHRRGTWVRTRETLFPGYLFVDTGQPEELHARLMQVPAFTRLLGGDGGFVPLTPEEVGFVNAMCGTGHVAEMSQGIIEGDEVRVLSGPLRDHEAIIEKIDRHKRAAYVRMSMLGRDVLVKLGLEIVRKVG